MPAQAVTESAPSPDAKTEKLQAVLAQARAIRGQTTSRAAEAVQSQAQPVRSQKPQRLNSRHVTSSKPARASRTTATSMLDRINNPPVVPSSGAKHSSSNNSRLSEQDHLAGKSSLGTAQKSQQKPSEHRLAEQESGVPSGLAGSTLQSQSETGGSTSQYPVPLQLPAEFRKALNALRWLTSLVLLCTNQFWLFVLLWLCF